MLIGDPKQAIYAFRGADVYAYLDGRAARPATQATLEVNWRSDQGLIDAYDALFGGAQARPRGDRLPARAGADAEPARRGWPARRSRAAAHPRRRTATSRRSRPRQAATPRNASAREHIAEDLAADLVRAARLRPSVERRRRRARAGRSPGTSRCSCSTNRTAALVRDALDDGRRPGGDQRRGQRVRARRRRASGCGCSRRSSARPSPPRAHAGGADAVPRLDAGAGRGGRRGRLGGRPPRACTTGRACCARAASRR